MENVRSSTQVLTYRETVSKRYRGGLEHRNIEPHAAKAYENKQNPERYPVQIFSTYVSKLPQDRIIEAFYFKSLSVFASESVWYSKQPVGKNKLDVTLKSVMQKANVSGLFTNHSLRATTATRYLMLLFPSNLSESKLAIGATLCGLITDRQKRKSVKCRKCSTYKETMHQLQKSSLQL